MSDLFMGQTMTEAYRFVSDGAAHTFTFNFPPDKVSFYNLSEWTGTAGGLPVSIWWRDETPAGDAYQQQVIDSAAGSSFNFIFESTNGFTDASENAGVESSHATISGITAADPGVITHSAFTFQNDQQIRITDLGPVGVSDRGMGPLNNNRYLVNVISATTLSLKDVLTGEPIDTSAFPAYVSGGRITLLSHVLSLNNPQVDPYSNSNPYDPTPYAYKAPQYKLTAGSAVMGSDSDVYVIEAVKFGSYINLGDIA